MSGNVCARRRASNGFLPADKSNLRRCADENRWSISESKLWSSDANDSRSARQRRDNRACLLPLVARRVRLALLSSGAPESLQKALTAILERGGLEGSVEGRESPLTASKRLLRRLVRTEGVEREAIQSAYRLSRRCRTKNARQ